MISSCLISYGLISSAHGLTAQCKGLNVPLNSFCRIGSPSGPFAKVIGFNSSYNTIMPLENNVIFQPSQKIYSAESFHLPLGDHLLGRVLDPMGRPLDGGTTLPAYDTNLSPNIVNPMNKKRITDVLDVGVRAINAFITVGKGQRLGIFAGSGVGKSTLLSMMAKYTETPFVVIGLIGERGREVREFIEESLGQEGLQKSILVVAPADATPLMKMQGAEYACRIAESIRDSGRDCLLIMDSLTRYAMAAREVGLAAGEPPATKGYPPSVFSKINTLVERAGTGGDHQGSITAFYTVLSEGDDLQDPVADNARAILDGHIVLSRKLADQGQYPPIDVTASVSRAISSIAKDDHLKAIRKIKQLISSYNDNADLINIGAYQKGTDTTIDQAILKRPSILSFLQQSQHDPSPFASSLSQLFEIAKS